MSARRRVALAGALFSPLLASAHDALALAPPAGTQAGHLARVAAVPKHAKGASPCGVDVPVVGPVMSEVTGGVCAAAGKAVGGLVSEAAGAVGNGVLDLLARWMIGAATQVTTLVARAIAQTSTPQLESSWFQAQFMPMADLGAALGLLVALIALASAAIRRSPEALAATLAGIARAGIGTGLIIALTVTGLSIADQISADVVSHSPHAFWSTVAHAWGQDGFGGFGSSALAMLIALIEVFAAIFVWLELIVRAAAIYVAVLFFPAALAASIWPALAAWPRRLGRLLLLFVILKPVALIILSLAGNAAAAGLSLDGGLPGSVGTILAATVIFALAAFAPWALMHLLAADAESAHTAAGLRAAGAGAVLDRDRSSVRSGGGLRNLSTSSGSGAGPNGGRGRPGSGPGSSGGGGGGSSPGHHPTGGADGAPGRPHSEETLPIGGEAVGAGSVGAAAGLGARRTLSPTSAGRGPDSPTHPDSATEQSGAAPRTDDPSISRLSAPPGGGRIVPLPIRGRPSLDEESQGSSSPNRDPKAPSAPRTLPLAPRPAPPRPPSKGPQGDE
jgi:hypothetical protein